LVLQSAFLINLMADPRPYMAAAAKCWIVENPARLMILSPAMVAAVANRIDPEGIHCRSAERAGKYFLKKEYFKLSVLGVSAVKRPLP
jgi:hypothetical protein